MKIETKTTVRIGKHPDVKYLPPGEHDVDDAVGADLVKRGKAVAVGATSAPPAPEPPAPPAKDDGKKPTKDDGKKDDKS